MDQHFRHSSYREKLIEHLFVGELLKVSWKAGDCSVEVAKPEVDNRGYDVILEHNGIVRHLQLKTSHRGARASSQKIHTALATKPSGCVVWIRFDPETLVLGPFLFFGGLPGQPLPAVADMRVARHTKANTSGVKAQRLAHRVVPKGKFKVIRSIEELFVVLLGAEQYSA